MADEDVCLGICYSDSQIYYSVNDQDKPSSARHIGAFDFNFNVKSAIVHAHDDAFLGVKRSIADLKEKFNCTSVRILSPADEECWTVLPRYVYENSDEREAHIRILAQSVPREDLQITWYNLSNVDHRLLLIRDSNAMHGFKKLLGDVSHTEYISEFEVGSEWQEHTNINGSFLTVHCGRNYISVSSFLLGKLRGATVITFEEINDLPYYWKLFAKQNSWMSGIHEQIYYYGYQADNIRKVLSPYWDRPGEQIIMNTLEKMHISAPEETYGFPLERAYPAILLSMNFDHQPAKEYHENHNGNS
jgi:hypothetical protein